MKKRLPNSSSLPGATVPARDVRTVHMYACRCRSQ